MRCEMYKCRDNSCGVCTCKYPIIGENCTCLAYLPMECKEAEFHEQLDKMTNYLYNQLGLAPRLIGDMTATDMTNMQFLSVDLVRKPNLNKTELPDTSFSIESTSDIDDVELPKDIAEEYK